MILNKNIDKVKNSQLVITPETSLTFDITRNEYYRDILKNKLKSLNTYLQVGSQAASVKDDNFKKYNSSFLISPAGKIENRYNKNRLVLFGEFIPFQKFVNNVAGTNLRSLTRGKGVEIFKTDFSNWKTVICSEILNPLFFQKNINKIDFVINQSNEAWYNKSNLKNQMWYGAKFRAVENRCSVVKAGNYAYNGLILPSGKQIKRDVNKKESFVVEIKINHTSTLYQKWGNYIGYISAIIWGLFIIIKIIVWIKKRRKFR